MGLEEINLETERGKIIGGLLDQVGAAVAVRHECAISGIAREANGGLTLLGPKMNPTYGTYDVVVDGTGIASALRHSRFTQKADAFYTGTVFVQVRVPM